MSDIRINAFDMDSFIKNNHNNAVHSLELLRQVKYWHHFDVITAHYHDLFAITDHDLSSSHSKMASLHFLSGCNVNFVKGVSNALSGHFTDSSIYIRRTIEAIRYSVFMREKPAAARIWFMPDKKNQFENKYRKWFQGLGKQLVESEFVRSRHHFEHSSNHGPHSNAELFSSQHSVSYKDSKMDFRIFYHELEPSNRGYHSLLATYFWHLDVHCSTINWWIYKSGFITHLTSDQIQLWSECEQKVTRDHCEVKEQIISGPLGEILK